MKTVITILLFIVTLFSYTNGYSQKKLSNSKTESCFSKENFEKVYQYVDNQNKKNNTQYFKCEKYDLYLSETTEISLIKGGYTLSKIFKEKGVVATSKKESDNFKMLKEANRILCKMLELAEKKN